MRSAWWVSLLVTWMSLVGSSVHAQSFDWAVRGGGIDFDMAEAVGVDGAGNSYVIGTFRAEARFGAGELNETDLTSAGSVASQDIFVAKFNLAGALVWARGIGGTDPSSGGVAGNDWGFGIAVDTSGNSYVTGGLASVTTFADVGGVTLGAPGAFIAKFDTNGNAVWATTLDQGGLGIAVAIDVGGNSYVTGSAPVPILGGSTATTWKISPSGGIVWVRQAVPAIGGGAMGVGIAVDGAGNAYVTGKIQGDAFTFGSGEPTQTVLTDLDSAAETFIASYDSNGNLNWVRQTADVPGSAQSGAGGIAVDSAGNTVVVGAGVTSLGGNIISGLVDCWLARFDSSGNFIWGKAVLGNGLAMECRGTSIDVHGDSFATGLFSATATFGAGEQNETTLSGSPGSDAFIAKFRADGSFVWARAAGVSADTGGSIGQGIHVDLVGAVHVAGYFTGSTTFGAGEPTATVLTSGGQGDAFIARYAGGSVPPPPVVDLDIDQFRVTNRVSISRGGSVAITLAVRNNGGLNGTADATVVGVQNGNEVYRESMPVFDPVGNGRTTFTFPGLTPVVAGDITWTVVIADGDADADVASSTTRVVS